MSFGRPYILKISGCIHDGWLLMSNFSEKINKDYLYEILSYEDTQLQFIESAAGGVVQNLNTGRVKATRIPLPPSEIQTQIAQACKVIDEEVATAQASMGHAKIEVRRKIESWFNSNFSMEKIEKVFSLEYGKPLPEDKRIAGEYPVMGSNGISGYHNEYLIEAPSIIVGRKGSAGKVVFVENNCYPIDTTFYVKPIKACVMKYLYYVLSTLELEKMIKGIGVPGINRNDVYQKLIPVPDLTIQQKLITEIAVHEANIAAAQKIIDEAASKKQAILKKYL
jgi:type I restriction enzyme M protein